MGFCWFWNDNGKWKVWQQLVLVSYIWYDGSAVEEHSYFSSQKSGIISYEKKFDHPWGAFMVSVSPFEFNHVFIYLPIHTTDPVRIKSGNNTIRLCGNATLCCLLMQCYAVCGNSIGYPMQLGLLVFCLTDSLQQFN